MLTVGEARPSEDTSFKVPPTVGVLLDAQANLIDLAEQLADAAQATQSRPLSCATAHTMSAVYALHEAAEAACEVAA